MSKQIQESQQQGQGITIGNQGNEDITIPQGTKGSHQNREQGDDRQIPNQERSSASNSERSIEKNTDQ